MLINVVDAADLKFCLPLRFLVAEIGQYPTFNVQFEGKLPRALVEVSDCRLLMPDLGW